MSTIHNSALRASTPTFGISDDATAMDRLESRDCVFLCPLIILFPQRSVIGCAVAVAFLRITNLFDPTSAAKLTRIQR